MPLVKKEPSKITYGDIVPKYIKLGDTQVRPVLPPPELCFTANTAGSTLKLMNNGGYSVTLEISTDAKNWSTYTFGNTITLTNIGDKVYWRNADENGVNFSKSNGWYQFSMTGSIAASGDVNYLCNKNSSTTSACYLYLFGDCTALTSAPSLPAVTLVPYCYRNMFYGCTNLETLPKLPATTGVGYCYENMFYYCSKIKLSYSQSGEYQTEYRIPPEGTGASFVNNMRYMFNGTGGEFAGTPNMNYTYYTSNTVV